MNALLKAVPGKAGHLFFTAGAVTGGNGPGVNPDDTSFMRSTDGGVTWTAVTGVKEVTAFGFGGGDYPAIVLAGWVNGDYGIWRSTDNAKIWVQVGDYPLGSLDAGDHARRLQGAGWSDRWISRVGVRNRPAGRHHTRASSGP